MILHIPHSSTETLGKTFLCNLEKELTLMTDVDTDKLFDYPKATKIVFSVSRLVCDVERFEDDKKEEMAAKGMGVCYTKTAFGEPLRELKDGEREEIVEKYYRPHHKALTEATREELEKNGSALIVDCHSFPNEPLPCNMNQNQHRPDICIGADDFHTPAALAEEAKSFFESCGYSVKINDPFAGTLIPMEFYGEEKRVQGIMLEVNRNLYENNFEAVKSNIFAWLDGLNNRY